MMLSNTQLHNLMSYSNREKLHKEVQRKNGEASDFQEQVSEMKPQRRPRYTGKLFKMAGPPKAEALGKHSNKESRFTHWAVKAQWGFEVPVKGDTLVKRLDPEKLAFQTLASSQTS